MSSSSPHALQVLLIYYTCENDRQEHFIAGLSLKNLEVKEEQLIFIDQGLGE
jgi:hypothetical protein